MVDRLHPVGDHELACPVEARFDHVALGGREHHALGPLLALEQPTVGTDDLQPRAAQREIVGPRVRGVGEKEAHYLAAPYAEPVVGLPVHEEHVPETAHQGVARGLVPERQQPVGVREQVVQHEDDLPVYGVEVVRARRAHQQVAVQPEVLLGILPQMGMVPIEPRVAKMHPVAEPPARRHGALGHARHAVRGILEPDAVPVHAGRPIDPVRELDDDRGVLGHADQRSGILAVEAVHHDRPSGDGAPHRHGGERERVAVPQVQCLARPRFGERRGIDPGAGPERRDSRLERLQPGNHQGHTGMHRGRAPANSPWVLVHRLSRKHTDRVRLHQPAGRVTPQHDLSSPALAGRTRLRRHEEQELVESDPARGVAAVRHSTQADHGVERRRRGPGYIRGIGAQRGGIGKPAHGHPEILQQVTVRIDRDVERSLRG